MSFRTWSCFALVFVVACGGAKHPGGRGAEVGNRYAKAVEASLRGDESGALEHTLALAELAGQDSGLLGLDAANAVEGLLTRSLAFESSSTAGLAHRTGTLHRTAERLLDSAVRGKSASAAPRLALLAAELFADAGDAEAAAEARQRSGCVQSATVSAPHDFRPGNGDRALERSRPGVSWTATTPSLFGAAIADARSQGRGCELLGTAAAAIAGARTIAVDVETGGHDTVTVHLESSGESTVFLGGLRVLHQAANAQRTSQLDVARVRVEGERLRLVVQTVADEEARSLQLHVVDERGRPLSTRPVEPSSAAPGRALEVLPMDRFDARSGEERAVVASGLQQRGHSSQAQRLVGEADSPLAAHTRLLVLASSTDLPDSERLDRQRQALEQLLAAWPNAWEARFALARNVGERRGDSESTLATFAALDDTFQAADASPFFVLASWHLAQSAKLHHVARALHPRLGAAAATPFGKSLQLDVLEALPAERVHDACGPLRAVATSLGCQAALAEAGRTREALAELERILRLQGAPEADAHARLRLLALQNDRVALERVVDAMPPGERTLALYFLAREGVPALTELLAEAARSDGAVIALPTLADRAEGSSANLARLQAFSRRASELVAADRAKPTAPEAPTFVLAHDEIYDVAPSGLLHYWLFDVRRLSGTTDVEETAEARRPSIYGMANHEVRLRRIEKRDGRIVLPDPTPMASQAHAELSQLEAGDYVVVAYEGYALPGPTWSLGFDTPDLLPERTAVAQASLQVGWPLGLGASTALHPSWGKATRSQTSSRQTLMASVGSASVRKSGAHLPRSERSVHFSFGTSSWARTAEAMADQARRVCRGDAELAAFRERAWKDAKARSVLERVEALRAAVGERVTQANGSALADYTASSAYGMSTDTVRNILATREGSRSVVLKAALDDAGIASEIVVAEREPWANGELYPPHPGRFVHPLLRLPVQKGLDEETWIDADVTGPPLPLGRISSELRGRTAMSLPSGKLAVLPEAPFKVGQDEVDLRLELDEQGDAQGELVLLLRGRLAGQLREAFTRVVGQERDRVLRSLVSAWVAGATVDEAAYSEGGPDGAVTLRARFTAPAYAERMQSPAGKAGTVFLLPGHVALPLGAGGDPATLLERYGSALAREGTLSIRDATRYHLRRSVRFPKGLQVLRTPGPLEVREPGLHATRVFQAQTQTLVDDVYFALESQTIERENVAAFVELLRRIDEGLLASERIGP